jgi:hypothetical protein
VSRCCGPHVGWAKARAHVPRHLHVASALLARYIARLSNRDSATQQAAQYLPLQGGGRRAKRAGWGATHGHDPKKHLPRAGPPPDSICPGARPGQMLPTSPFQGKGWSVRPLLSAGVMALLLLAPGQAVAQQTDSSDSLFLAPSLDGNPQAPPRFRPAPKEDQRQPAQFVQLPSFSYRPAIGAGSTGFDSTNGARRNKKTRSTTKAKPAANPGATVLGISQQPDGTSTKTDPTQASSPSPPVLRCATFAQAAAARRCIRARANTHASAARCPTHRPRC